MMLTLFWTCISLYVLGALLMIYSTPNGGWISVLYAICWPVLVAAGFLTILTFGIVGIFIKDKK
jgi:hypothetical protein